MFTTQAIDRAFHTLDQMSFAGIAVGIGFNRGTPRRSFFSYDQEFLTRYQTEDIARHDPTLDFGFTQDGIVSWSDLKDRNPDNAAFQLADEYGIRDAICVALTIEGQKTIASVSQDPDSPFSDQQIQTIHDHLSLAALEVLRATRPTPYKVKTSEFLEMAARGMSDKEMAEGMGLSLAGARARRKAALIEIGAKTSAQALTIAIARGAINPYAFV